MRKVATDATLATWRALDATVVLERLGCYSKQDVSFRPVRAHGTLRFHVQVQGAEFELLLDGPKFFDSRANRGGGGALDLVMHLYGLDFKAAARRLQEVL